MTKAELIKALSTKTGMGVAQTENVLARLADITAESILDAGEALIPGVGKLELTFRAARTGRNPKTGEEVQIEAKRAVKFKAAKALKDAVA
ncbi:HU family DNA-binding protein [Pseudomonas sp.]|uniref:HU family DNA-binding protein n=1 Tax=Pseudomonas sp. TaxID=306 RepID=UPI002584C13B|nr:HU family DNA-binding protein [Pseudomonas sp.]